MNYWWVNHKQTFKNEFEGGYIWSPERNKNDSYNKSYENLTKTDIGDLIFSYSDAVIKAIGVIEGDYAKATKPLEFGKAGSAWGNNGYLVKVDWVKLKIPLRPKSNIRELVHLLPSKYSPIQKNGNGVQNLYLSSISKELANTLLDLIKRQDSNVTANLSEIENKVKDDQEEAKINNQKIPATQKDQLIKARIGQGIFRTRVLAIEKNCRVTKVSDSRFLVASHIKPWRKSNDVEKLDGNNGLLMSPHLDKLFDRGWITFTNEGEILMKEEAREIIKKWNIPIESVGRFNLKQKKYLEYHRQDIFKMKSD